MRGSPPAAAPGRQSPLPARVPAEPRPGRGVGGLHAVALFPDPGRSEKRFALSALEDHAVVGCRDAPRLLLPGTGKWGSMPPSHAALGRHHRAQCPFLQVSDAHNRSAPAPTGIRAPSLSQADRDSQRPRQSAVPWFARLLGVLHLARKRGALTPRPLPITMVLSALRWLCLRPFRISHPAQRTSRWYLPTGYLFSGASELPGPPRSSAAGVTSSAAVRRGKR